VNAGIVP